MELLLRFEQREVLKELIVVAEQLHEFIEDINENYSKDQKKDLLKTLWKTAIADGKLDVDEEKLVRRVADLIKIKDIEVLRLKHDAKN